MNEEKIETKHTTIKEKIEKSTKVMDLDIRLPVLARVKKRIKKIHELSRAVTRKIPMGNMHVFETVPPKMFITNLSAKVNGGKGIISYQLYKMDSEGNKLARVTQRKVNGAMIDFDGQYILDKIIVETIEYMKPLVKEEMSYESK